MLECFWSKPKTVLLPATEDALSAAIVNIPGKMPVVLLLCVGTTIIFKSQKPVCLP